MVVNKWVVINLLEREKDRGVGWVERGGVHHQRVVYTNREREIEGVVGV